MSNQDSFLEFFFSKESFAFNERFSIFRDSPSTKVHG